MTDDRKIRLGCIARGLNMSLGRSCSDEEPCIQCWMEKDVKENAEFYRALGGDQ